MVRSFGIAIGAGVASALLFTASAKGAGLSIIVAYVTPLPIMIAALGFSQSTGLLAAVVASGAIALVLGFLPAAFFAGLLGFPSWFLCFLSLLARPLNVSGPGAPADKPGLLLWYPMGRVAAWAAAIVAGVLLAVGALVILHFNGFEPAVSAISSRVSDLVGPGGDDLSAGTTTRNLVKMLPILLAASAFLMLMVNLWLAGRIVERSSLLVRPWPSIPENYRLPKVAALTLVVGGLVAVTGGAAGLAGGVVASAFATAFVFQGLGAAHALTRGLAARRLILSAIYFITFTVVPSLLALAVLGVVDCLLPLRHRQAAQPPLPKA